MIDNKKLKTTLTTNFQLPKQVNKAKEEAFAKIKASKVSEAAKTEVSSTISSTSETVYFLFILFNVSSHPLCNDK